MQSEKRKVENSQTPEVLDGGGVDQDSSGAPRQGQVRGGGRRHLDKDDGGS
jgi:hypothetical protein